MARDELYRAVKRAIDAKRTDVVRRAIELIGPKLEDGHECERYIKHTLWEVANERSNLPLRHLRKSRAGKDAALRLQRVLEKNLYDALTDPELPDDVGLLIRRNYAANPLFPTVPYLTKPEIDEWLRDQV